MSNNQFPDRPSDPAWIKSSYSGTSGGECVEVAVGLSAVLVRDSKNVNGPVLRVAGRGWGTFVGFASGRKGIGA
ncbi:DUF397 domain-containing protein [Streptomyces sp. NPDC096310]|uniref:DUF397 domain-containing protein n=1 Tax=Streptomyces sp. NPDC096310 TaxID=3366082 RepID=UPI003821F815